MQPSIHPLTPAQTSAPTEQPAPTPARALILGLDVLLAALPATAVQVAHACTAAGYDPVVPVTWGDELIAAAYLDELARRDGRPAVCCSCPLVAARLTESGGALAHALIPLVPPPVATARYLRQLVGDAPLHVTYAGGCPLGGEAADVSAGAAARPAIDSAMDARITPAELLEMLAARGIVVTDQPTTFDAVLPPDRRRHLSLPGGVPSPEALAMRALPYRLLELTGDDYATELAEFLLGGDALLLDVAPWLGCSCSGAVPGMDPVRARRLAATLEPPRSTLPVVDLALQVDVRAELPAITGEEGARTTDRREEPDQASRARRPAVPAPTHPLSRLVTPPAVRAVSGGASRRSPIALPRVWAGAFPRARIAENGRKLPRAYMATRRSHPWLTPIPSPADERPAEPPPPPAGGEFGAFVAGLAAAVADDIPPVVAWRVTLDTEIQRWEADGYATAVLRRARALTTPPDVDGLLRTFAAAVDYLRRLESLATTVRPSLRGAPIFRDPTTVRAAEELVDGILRA